MTTFIVGSAMTLFLVVRDNVLPRAWRDTLQLSKLPTLSLWQWATIALLLFVPFLLEGAYRASRRAVAEAEVNRPASVNAGRPADFSLVQGDSATPLTTTPLDASGNPYPVMGGAFVGATVRFRMRSLSDHAKLKPGLEADAAILTTSSVYQLRVAATFFAAVPADIYEGAFVITYADGTVTHLPRPDFLSIRIVAAP